MITIIRDPLSPLEEGFHQEQREGTESSELPFLGHALHDRLLREFVAAGITSLDGKVIDTSVGAQMWPPVSGQLLFSVVARMRSLLETQIHSACSLFHLFHKIFHTFPGVDFYLCGTGALSVLGEEGLLFGIHYFFGYEKRLNCLSVPFDVEEPRDLDWRIVIKDQEHAPVPHRRIVAQAVCGFLENLPEWPPGALSLISIDEEETAYEILKVNVPGVRPIDLVFISDYWTFQRGWSIRNQCITSLDDLQIKLTSYSLAGDLGLELQHSVFSPQQYLIDHCTRTFRIARPSMFSFLRMARKGYRMLEPLQESQMVLALKQDENWENRLCVAIRKDLAKRAVLLPGIGKIDSKQAISYLIRIASVLERHEPPDLRGDFFGLCWSHLRLYQLDLASEGAEFVARCLVKHHVPLGVMLSVLGIVRACFDPNDVTWHLGKRFFHFVDPVDCLISADLSEHVDVLRAYFQTPVGQDEQNAVSCFLLHVLRARLPFHFAVHALHSHERDLLVRQARDWVSVPLQELESSIETVNPRVIIGWLLSFALQAPSESLLDRAVGEYQFFLWDGDQGAAEWRNICEEIMLQRDRSVIARVINPSGGQWVSLFLKAGAPAPVLFALWKKHERSESDAMTLFGYFLDVNRALALDLYQEGLDLSEARPMFLSWFVNQTVFCPISAELCQRLFSGRIESKKREEWICCVQRLYQQGHESIADKIMECLLSTSKILDVQELMRLAGCVQTFQRTGANVNTKVDQLILKRCRFEQCAEDPNGAALFFKIFFSLVDSASQKQEALLLLNNFMMGGRDSGHPLLIDEALWVRLQTMIVDSEDIPLISTHWTLLWNLNRARIVLGSSVRGKSAYVSWVLQLLISSIDGARGVWKLSLGKHKSKWCAWFCSQLPKWKNRNWMDSETYNKVFLVREVIPELRATQDELMWCSNTVLELCVWWHLKNSQGETARVEHLLSKLLERDVERGWRVLLLHSGCGFEKLLYDALSRPVFELSSSTWAVVWDHAIKSSWDPALLQQLWEQFFMATKKEPSRMDSEVFHKALDCVLRADGFKGLGLILGEESWALARATPAQRMQITSTLWHEVLWGQHSYCAEECWEVHLRWRAFIDLSQDQQDEWHRALTQELFVPSGESTVQIWKMRLWWHETYLRANEAVDGLYMLLQVRQDAIDGLLQERFKVLVKDLLPSLSPLQEGLLWSLIVRYEWVLFDELAVSRLVTCRLQDVIEILKAEERWQTLESVCIYFASLARRGNGDGKGRERLFMLWCIFVQPLYRTNSQQFLRELELMCEALVRSDAQSVYWERLFRMILHLEQSWSQADRARRLSLFHYTWMSAFSNVGTSSDGIHAFLMDSCVCIRCEDPGLFLSFFAAGCFSWVVGEQPAYAILRDEQGKAPISAASLHKLQTLISQVDLGFFRDNIDVVRQLAMIERWSGCQFQIGANTIDSLLSDVDKVSVTREYIELLLIDCSFPSLVVALRQLKQPDLWRHHTGLLSEAVNRLIGAISDSPDEDRVIHLCDSYKESDTLLWPFFEETLFALEQFIEDRVMFAVWRTFLMKKVHEKLAYFFERLHCYCRGEEDIRSLDNTCFALVRYLVLQTVLHGRTCRRVQWHAIEQSKEQIIALHRLLHQVRALGAPGQRRGAVLLLTVHWTDLWSAYSDRGGKIPNMHPMQEYLDHFKSFCAESEQGAADFAAAIVPCYRYITHLASTVDPLPGDLQHVINTLLQGLRSLGTASEVPQERFELFLHRLSLISLVPKSVFSDEVCHTLFCESWELLFPLLSNLEQIHPDAMPSCISQNCITLLAHATQRFVTLHFHACCCCKNNPQMIEEGRAILRGIILRLIHMDRACTGQMAKEYQVIFLSIYFQRGLRVYLKIINLDPVYYLLPLFKKWQEDVSTAPLIRDWVDFAVAFGCKQESSFFDQQHRAWRERFAGALGLYSPRGSFEGQVLLHILRDMMLAVLSLQYPEGVVALSTFLLAIQKASYELGPSHAQIFFDHFALLGRRLAHEQEWTEQFYVQIVVEFIHFATGDLLESIALLGPKAHVIKICVRADPQSLFTHLLRKRQAGKS